MKKILLLMLIVFQACCICSCSSGEKKSSGNLISYANGSNSALSESINQSSKVEGVDDDNLLKILISLENEWKQAKKSGQIDKLNRIYADEFTNKDEEGNVYTKAEWINYWSKGDPNLKSIEVTDGKIVSRQSNMVTITSKVISAYKYKNKLITETIDTDSFVFRDGRWQVISSISRDSGKNND